MKNLLLVEAEIQLDLGGDVDNLCYSDIPQLMSTIVYPDGAQGGLDGDGYSVQWQYKDSNTGDDFVDIDDATDWSYEPTESLTEDTYYRVEVYSDVTDSAPYICGPVYSEEIFVDVYEQFNGSLVFGIFLVNQIIFLYILFVFNIRLRLLHSEHCFTCFQDVW